MFTRKISPESFDESLLHQKAQSHLNSQQKISQESGLYFNHKIDPVTGELFDQTHQAFMNQSDLGQISNQTLKNNFSTLEQFKNLIRPLGPILCCGLILCLAIAWLGFHLLDEIQNRTEAQSKQIKLVHQGQSEILNALDDLHEQVFNNEIAITELSEISTTNNSKTEQTINSQITNKPQLKIATSKPKQLKGIKYLGSIKQNDAYQTLIEIDGKVRTLSIGDILKDGWQLSAIDPKKIVITTNEGARQIIGMMDGKQ